MEIITREQLKSMPNGTVFMKYTPHMLDGEIHIICGRYNNQSGYNGEISTTPFFQLEPSSNSNSYYTQWCSVDTCDYDYEEDQLFAIFSKTEIMQIINVLNWALSNCEANIDMDHWYNRDKDPIMHDDDFEE